MIYFEKVSKIYPDKSKALDEVTFTVEPKEFTTIVGHSGAGKTTLLKMLIAEDRPTHGSIFFESKNIHKLGKGDINKLRRRIGTVFQDFRLIPNKTTYENIAFAMEASGRTDKEIASDVPYVLDLVNLGDKIWNFPHELCHLRLNTAIEVLQDPAFVTHNTSELLPIEFVQLLVIRDRDRR
jgi:cell division transport system ATP-binding protein